MSEATSVESPTPWVFEIPERNLPQLEERLAKMVKRARKCTLPPPTLEVIWEADETKSKRAKENPKLLQPWPMVEYIVRYFYVVVAGEKPHIKDWEFVATVEHGDEVGNLIKSVPGAGQIPVVYRKAQPVCDHCGTARRRIETFILRNSNDGTHKQVGRNCLQDFFGGENPSQIAQYLQWWTECVELLQSDFGEEESYGGGGGAWNRFEISEVLKLTQAVIDCCGWMSRTKAQELYGVSPTADLVAGQLDPPNRQTDHDKELAKKLVFKNEYDQMVADALEWVRGLNPEESEDYLYNLHVVCKGETVQRKRFGLVCSLMAAHRRFLDGERQKKERAEKPQSQHVGTIKERTLLKGMKIVFIGEPSAGFNEFSSTRMVKFEDEAGNVFVWWCSTEAPGGVGETFDVVATIKDHSTYTPMRGDYRDPVKQTIINRVTVWDGKWKPKKKKE